MHGSARPVATSAYPLIGLAALLASGPQASADAIYRTLGPDGTVMYSDHPLSSASQRISVQVTEPNPDDAARLAREQQLQKVQAAEQSKQAQQQAAQQQQQAAQDASRQQRCAAARDRYAVFATGGRIFHADAQGNRVYYSDEEIEQRRTAAKAAMDSTCAR
jgi:hypothetical protein